MFDAFQFRVTTLMEIIMFFMLLLVLLTCMFVYLLEKLVGIGNTLCAKIDGFCGDIFDNRLRRNAEQGDSIEANILSGLTELCIDGKVYRLEEFEDKWDPDPYYN